MRNRAAPDARQSTGATGHDGLRLLVLTQYYHPEVGAAQTRLRETVIGLRRRGFRVTVLAPVPSYPLGLVPEPYAWWRPTRERIDGARVMRLPTIAAPGAGMSRRMIAHATFALTSLAGLAVAGRFDVVLVESPPLLLALPARTLMASGVPYVFHVADPWPDFPIAMGYLQSRLERRLAFGLENLAYRGAAAITTVSPGLVELLSRKTSAAGRVELVPNGVDVARFGVGLTPPAARRRLGWDEAFTVVYAGTIGLAQGVGTLLDAASLVDGRIRIRIIGEGVEKPQLEARARVMHLENVVFHPSVPRTDVPAILAAADAGLVLLRKGPLYEESHPTKLLETMAAGRPAIVAADGLASRIVEESGGGYVAPAEDPMGLARAIEACRQDAGRELRGAAARDYVARHYERGVILDRLAGILAGAARAT
jgi:colanic acid biosynthesis glycosyl transferase WcaI